jgi:hypothetical protein
MYLPTAKMIPAVPLGMGVWRGAGGRGVDYREN